ncbi:hypothetical protein D2E25_1128 [Bifidobacterium goeldii]|uniref:Alpha/beta hydrolase n=1 Tax=Bifidobacterium goeldii TaxID=2306975 RepID=A0A430FJT7_9BIFI|nr:alpha/beta hydrolase [Bifidobacterium goeldii]RSX53155.1 hypothetical protein D2E25_1128 [Bifidobacterium goeldii]
MTNNVVTIGNEYIPLTPFQGVVVYRPVDEHARIGVTIMLMHSDDVYHGFVPAPELAQRGFTVVTSTIQHAAETLDEKITDLARAVDWAKQHMPNNRLILLGHSGGATLMSAYQAIAERGEQVFQDEHRIIKLSHIGPLTPADGIMLLDSNFGNGVMSLLSLEPGLADPDDARTLKADYDLFAETNGWVNETEGAHYSPEFVARYVAAQAARNDQLIDYALSRLRLIEAGEGRFEDDEPMTILGGNQFAPCNRLFPQDLAYLSHTEHEWPIIHADGTISEEIVASKRRPRYSPAPTRINGLSTKQTTVRSFLTNFAVRTHGFNYDASRVNGIDWDSAYCNTPGNVQHIAVPALIMGNTGSYEFMAAEQIYANIASTDKTLTFVEGASHNFTPETSAEEYPGQFGDTVTHCFDFVAHWLKERF